MSAPQPAVQELDRWPVSWYIPADKDSPIRLRCIARDCDHIFKTNTDIRYRWNHWQHFSDYKKEMSTDHAILRALNNQRNCPYCDYSINHKGLTIRDLFQHELDDHKSSNTTNIAGIVILVREGLFRTVTPELQEMVFERMCQILKTIPEYRVMLNYCHLPPYTIGENFKSLLAPEELRPRRPSDSIPPFYTPFPAETFLSHLEPKPDDRWAEELNWKFHWNNLRIMYLYGMI